MKNQVYLTGIIVAILFILTGITACSTNSQTHEDSILRADNSIDDFPTSNYTEPSSAEFTLQSSSTNTDVDLDADNTSTNEQLTFDVYSSNQLDVTSTLYVNTALESQNSDLLKVNPVYQAYQNAPSNISYNGYSTLHYSINGISYSASLTTQQQNIFDDLQLELNEAASYSGDGGGPTPVLNSANTSSSVEDSAKPLEAMTDKEISKWLKDKGYKVKELGDRRFQITRKYKEDTPDKSMSITSIFDAVTGKMEQGYTASKDGKLLAKHLEKEEKKSRKSKLKRANGEYLLLDITQKEKQN